jgi:hypothetical protein
MSLGSNMLPYNLNQRIRHVLYALKRQYGAAIAIHKLKDSSTNVRTGKKVTATEVINVPRAIVLPGHSTRKAIRGISLISANKMLVEGGTYDSNSRDFIVDRLDAPGLTTLTPDDWIVYQGCKYQVSEVQSFEVDAALIITAKQLVGEVPQATVVATANNQLDLVSEAAVTP